MTEHDKAHRAIIDIHERGFTAGVTDVHLAPGRAGSGMKYKSSTDQASTPVGGDAFREIIALGEPVDEATFASMIAYLQVENGIVLAAGTRHRFSVNGDAITFRRIPSLAEFDAEMENKFGFNMFPASVNHNEVPS